MRTLFSRIAVVTAALAISAPLLPTPAAAWPYHAGWGWHHGWRGCCWRPGVVVGVPPVVVVRPPVVIAPAPVAGPVWIAPHWRGPYWVPGHWG